MNAILDTIYAYASLFLMLFFVFRSRRSVLGYFRKLAPFQVLALACVIAVAAWLRFVFFEPKHLMYYDEFWYMGAAKDIITHGVAPWYVKSMGWPVVLSLSFFIFGISNLVAVHTSSLLGILTLLNIYLLVVRISGSRWTGIAAMAFFSLLPDHLLWSTSAETNVPSLYFVTLGIFFSLEYFKEKTELLLWTSLTCIGFTALIRPENYFYFFLFAFGIILFFRPRPRGDFRFWAPWILSASLTLPNLIRIIRHYWGTLWLDYESGGALAGANFSLSNFFQNAVTWGTRLLDASRYPFLFIALFLLGNFYFFKNFRRYWAFTVAWFTGLCAAYFSSWLQTLGGNTRLYLSFDPILTIWASGGVLILSPGQKKKTLLQILIFALLTGLLLHGAISRDRTEFLVKELELKVLDGIERYVSKDDIVLTSLPYLLTATADIRTYPLKDFLSDETCRKRVFASAKRVLFFEDYARGLPDLEAVYDGIFRDHKLLLLHRFTDDRPFSKDNRPAINLYQVL